MKTRDMKYLCNYLFLFFLVAQASYAQSYEKKTASEIISAYISATGGEVRWRNLHSLETITMVHYPPSVEPSRTGMGQGGANQTRPLIQRAADSVRRRPKWSVQIERTAVHKVGTRLVTTLLHNGVSETVIVNQYTAWQSDPTLGDNQLTELSKSQHKTLLSTLDQLDIQGQFIRYAEKGYQYTSKGRTTRIDKKKCYLVKGLSPTKEKSKHYFDAETGLLLQSQSKANTLRYSDYRPVGGYLMPRRIHISAGPQRAQFFVRYIRANHPINPQLFSY